MKFPLTSVLHSCCKLWQLWPISIYYASNNIQETNRELCWCKVETENIDGARTHPSSDADPALSGLFLTKFSRETWNSQVHLHKARNKGETHDQNWDGQMCQSSATHWQDRHGCRTLDASWIWSAGSIRVRIKVLKTYDYGLMSTFCCCRLVAKCWTNIVCWLEIPDALPKVMTALAPLLYRVAEQQTLRCFTTYWVG